MVVDGIQLIIAQARIQILGHGQGIDVGVFQLDARPLGSNVHEAHIELVGIVGDEHPALRKFRKHTHCLVRRGGVRHHAVVDAGELHDLGRDGLARVHKGAEGFGDLAVLATTAPISVRNSVSGLRPAVSVSYTTKLPLMGAGGFAVQHRNHIIHKVGFNAVDHLEVRIAFADGICRQHRFRETLYHTIT